MLVLCVWALLVLGGASLFPVDPATQTILEYADILVCVLFLADFLHCLATAPRPVHYLLTWGWIDLLSSIPSVGIFRLGRVARLMRILRVVRGIRSARMVAQFLAGRRQESALLVSALMCLLVLVSASIAILQFEVPAGGSINTAETAMWWAFSTMTTLGFGDAHPITVEGRFVAVFLVASGVGAFGMLSGLIAAWFLAPAPKEPDTDLAELKSMVADLRAQLRFEREFASIDHLVRSLPPVKPA
jgi:voltage-gated potassium channel